MYLTEFFEDIIITIKHINKTLIHKEYTTIYELLHTFLLAETKLNRILTAIKVLM